jgi:hypothetical protein
MVATNIDAILIQISALHRCREEETVFFLPTGHFGGVQGTKSSFAGTSFYLST